jgi:hypothetical protein
MEVSKLRPINQINVGGRVLEQMFINRIMHHAYSNNHFNHNQFGFTPRKSAIDAALAVNEYLENRMTEGHISILVILDVKCAFDAVWFPSFLQTLKKLNCLKRLFNLAKICFSERRATLSTNGIEKEKNVSKRCPQVSCFVHGYWTIQYNSLLNLEFGKRTKAIAVANDLIITVRPETVREEENFANIEISKESNWAKVNKRTFNE